MGYYDFMKEKSNVDLNFMIERLRTFNKYEHIKKDCFSLCISICVKGPKNKKAWEESKVLAKSVITGEYKKVLPKKATHFL